ncbi:hypothetical protein HDU91_000811, partial [Kappamyces sp. JEL0680]
MEPTQPGQENEPTGVFAKIGKRRTSRRPSGALAKPLYEQMELPELKAIASQYGLKTTASRGFLVSKLDEIWRALHGTRPTSPSKPKVSEDDQNQRIFKAIQADHFLYSKMLCFEPLPFDAVFATLSASPSLEFLTRKKLKSFLDQQGINVQTEGRREDGMEWWETEKDMVLMSSFVGFDPNLTVAVVGAGLAGITAAREIYNIFLNTQQAIPQIVLYEARQRIGGRIFTFPLHCRWTDEDATPCVDLGSAYLSGPSRHLLTQLGLTGKWYDFNNFQNFQLFDFDGSLVSNETFEAAKEFISQIMNSVKASLSGQTEKTSSIGELFEQKMKSHELFDQLHESHLRMVHWHLACMEFEYQSSLGGIVEQPNRSRQLVISGGLGQVPHGLAYGTDPERHYSLNIECGK